MPIYVNFSSSGGKCCLETLNSRVHGVSHGHKTVTPWNMDTIAFAHGVQSPRDVSTGHAAGKRQHEPITITKETDAGSPLLYRMACNHEVFDTLNINFEQVDSKGLKQPYLAMNLTNVTVVGVKRKPHPGKHELEEISFTFEKIVMLYQKGKSWMKDDWGSGS